MEFAIVVGLLCMLLFGVIDFGSVYNDYQSVRSGSREGARLATVDDIYNAPSCRIAGATITPPASPTTKAAATQALICKTKERIGLDGDDIKVRVSVPNATIGEDITVCAVYPVQTLTGFFDVILGGKQLKSTVVMRLEQTASFEAYDETGGAC